MKLAILILIKQRGFVGANSFVHRPKGRNHPIPTPTLPLKGRGDNSFPFRGKAKMGVGLAGVQPPCYVKRSRQSRPPRPFLAKPGCSRTATPEIQLPVTVSLVHDLAGFLSAARHRPQQSNAFPDRQNPTRNLGTDVGDGIYNQPIACCAAFAITVFPHRSCGCAMFAEAACR